MDLLEVNRGVLIAKCNLFFPSPGPVGLNFGCILELLVRLQQVQIQNNSITLKSLGVEPRHHYFKIPQVISMSLKAEDHWPTHFLYSIQGFPSPSFAWDCPSLALKVPHPSKPLSPEYTWVVGCPVNTCPSGSPLWLQLESSGRTLRKTTSDPALPSETASISLDWAPSTSYFFLRSLNNFNI